MKYSEDEIRKAFKKAAPNFDDVPNANKLMEELKKSDWVPQIGEVIIPIDTVGYEYARVLKIGEDNWTGWRPLSTQESGVGELVDALEILQDTEWLDHDDLDAWKKQQSDHCKVAAKALEKWREVRGEE